MANKANKTEHSGAKHGNGAYWGYKADAKRSSNKTRRTNGKTYSMGYLASHDHTDSAFDIYGDE
jgi:hypothetical protein